LSPKRKAADAGTGADTATSRLDTLITSKEIVISCGSGGVGKTSVSAAVGAMTALRHGGKVLVVTVDPAKRLAAALGIEGFGNQARRVPNEAFTAVGLKPRGELWAAMLDTKQSWDDLVRRHAPTPKRADEILSNRLYTNITGRFVQSHEYIAMERLYELHSSGQYDLIVVDTPPTRNALDFLQAPSRMADFFSSRFLKILAAPSRSRVLGLATKPFTTVADRILGNQFLGDIAEFFELFESMAPGFVERARAVERVLHDRRTTFLVVTTLEANPVHEAQFFLRSLDEMGFHLGAVVLNKVLPTWLLADEPARLADHLREDRASIAATLAAQTGADVHLTDRVLAEIADAFTNYQLVAKREAEEQTQLAATPEVLVAVPAFDADIHDLSGLFRIGDALFR
jgi:anion-transporting  ArsA/GET3 family ATPase